MERYGDHSLLITAISELTSKIKVRKEAFVDALYAQRTDGIGKRSPTGCSKTIGDRYDKGSASSSSSMSRKTATEKDHSEEQKCEEIVSLSIKKKEVKGARSLGGVSQAKP